MTVRPSRVNKDNIRNNESEWGKYQGAYKDKSMRLPLDSQQKP